jgi:hypothetical protein
MELDHLLIPEWELHYAVNRNRCAQVLVVHRPKPDHLARGKSGRRDEIQQFFLGCVVLKSMPNAKVQQYKKKDNSCKKTPHRNLKATLQDFRLLLLRKPTILSNKDSNNGE